MSSTYHKIGAALLTLETRREQLLAMAIAAAIPPVQAYGVETSGFYINTHFRVVDTIVCEVNEVVMIEPEAVADDVKRSWLSRMETLYQPFEEKVWSGSWDDLQGDLSAEELDAAKTIFRLVASLL